MSLVTCTDCEREHSNLASACVHCGRPNVLANSRVTPRRPQPADEDSPLASAGWVALCAGLIGLAFALFLDTSVATEGGLYGLPARVNNIGLMDARQNYVIVSVATALAGVVMLAAAYRPRGS